MRTATSSPPPGLARGRLFRARIHRHDAGVAPHCSLEPPLLSGLQCTGKQLSPHLPCQVAEQRHARGTVHQALSDSRRVRSRKLEGGRTSSAIAHDLGWSTAMLSNCRKGRRALTATRILQLTQYFRVTPNVFFAREKQASASAQPPRTTRTRVGRDAYDRTALAAIKTLGGARRRERAPRIPAARRDEHSPVEDQAIVGNQQIVASPFEATRLWVSGWVIVNLVRAAICSTSSNQATSKPAERAAASACAGGLAHEGLAPAGRRPDPARLRRQVANVAYPSLAQAGGEVGVERRQHPSAICDRRLSALGRGLLTMEVDPVGRIGQVGHLVVQRDRDHRRGGGRGVVSAPRWTSSVRSCVRESSPQRVRSARDRIEAGASTTPENGMSA